MGGEVKDVAEDGEGVWAWWVVFARVAFGVEVVSCSEDECEEEGAHG